MRRKRGQTSVQFNWIFALIAGAVILGFFITVVIKQRDSAEIQAAGALASRMESLMAGAKVSTGKASLINIREVDLLFDCENYRIGTQGAIEIGNKVLFSPDRIKGDGLILWSQPWKMPYEVTNFLYITSPEVKYVLVGNSQPMKDLNKSLPKIMNKELVTTLSSATDRGETKVRIVSELAPTPSDVVNFERANDQDITWVHVKPGKDSFAVVFFRFNGNSWVQDGQSYSLGRPSLYGAIFAENKELFECNMQDAFENLNLVNKMYTLRTEELESSAGLSNSCNVQYSYVLQTSFADIEIASKTFSETNAMTIDTASFSLESANKAAQGLSCPVIY